MTADDCTDSMLNSSGGFIVESFWLKINMQIGTCSMPVIAQITSEHFFGVLKTSLKMWIARFNALGLQTATADTGDVRNVVKGSLKKCCFGPNDELFQARSQGSRALRPIAKCQN